MEMRKRKPGDLILDRYMAGASPKEREIAHQNLRALARVLVRIEDRVAREWYAQQIRKEGIDSVELENA